MALLTARISRATLTHVRRFFDVASSNWGNYRVNMSGAFRHALGIGLVTLAFGVPIAFGQNSTNHSEASLSADRIGMPPLTLPMRQYLAAHPEEMRALIERVTREAATRPPSPPPPAGSPWTVVKNPIITAGNPLLLTDGTVIVTEACTGLWFKLTPDSFGQYSDGDWSQIAQMPSGYAPRFFASAVLPDGRAIAMGGEYNASGGVCPKVGNDSNLGAIYDPVKNAWTAVAAPKGWTKIGDAQSVVLDDGTFMLADALSYNAALLDAAKLTWTATGTNKADPYDEEGWTLLPDGTVLTVNAYVPKGPACGTGSEIYDPSTGAWSNAGSTKVQLPDCNSTNPTYELGPQALLPYGIVMAFGGRTAPAKQNVADPTAFYSTITGKWAAGPDVPSVRGTNYTLADAPAVVLPSGNILFAASPSQWATKSAFPNPTHFFEFDGTSITQVADAPGASTTNSFEWNFLVLPTGQILAVDTDFTDISIYSPSGSPDPSWAPTISSFPRSVKRGSDYMIGGYQFNGLTQGAVYGDDVQASTNYPIVRLTNVKTGHVFYGRTHDHSSMSVTPNQFSWTNFTVPAKAETGRAYLAVIANGIASLQVTVTVD